MYYTCCLAHRVGLEKDLANWVFKKSTQNSFLLVPFRVRSGRVSFKFYRSLMDNQGTKKTGNFKILMTTRISLHKGGNGTISKTTTLSVKPFNNNRPENWIATYVCRKKKEKKTLTVWLLFIGNLGIIITFITLISR